MADVIDERIEQASSAQEEEVALFVHDPSPRVVKALLANRHIGEREVLIIANRKNLPGDVLQAIAKDKRWVESYPIRLALAKNPTHTLVFSAARYIKRPIASGSVSSYNYAACWISALAERRHELAYKFNLVLVHRMAHPRIEARRHIAAEPPHSVTNHVANDPEGILDSICSAMSTIAHNNAVSSGHCAVVIGPEHARTIWGYYARQMPRSSSKPVFRLLRCHASAGTAEDCIAGRALSIVPEAAVIVRRL